MIKIDILQGLNLKLIGIYASLLDNPWPDPTNVTLN